MSLDASRSLGVGAALGLVVGVSVGALTLVLDSGATATYAVGFGAALGLVLGVASGTLCVPLARWSADLAQPVTPLLAGGTLAGLALGLLAGVLAWWAVDASLLVAGCWALGGGLLGLLLAGAHAVTPD
ncbi:hypothetical protein [Halarchaeum sp. P4]|uniref:hypothetical protein n=1 Tax=Halarchaeum sp. P4 TaxID=3421639 RepID=UPI003EC0B907